MTLECSKCQHKNPDVTFYCGRCGARLLANEDISLAHTKTLKVFTPSKTIAGKYKIQAELGRGGMGVVYKAEDTRLKRIVALKFLPAELTKDIEAKKRFVQEGQAAAALEHPNICTVYEVDEADGQTFIAMSYIEGQSLKDKLNDGPLDVDEAKDITLQVAAGLEKAHKKGIVHRDIKPANIMINDEGQAKITDFGLAKLSWGADLTKPATVMGTVAYMSPEQARGEEVDRRTDIWSLGAMFYEMLSGRRPFEKEKEQALIFSILNDKPTPLSLLRSDIPTHIEQVIEKALSKKPSERFPNVQDLIQALESSLPISLPKTTCSIVVLPFDDMSPNRDNEYFSDGLTEEIITDLSQVRELCIISRNSAMALKGTKKNTKTIGKELNVRYVLEGSVRKAGDNLRITAQLIDATTDIHLWAEKYSGKLDDIFDIQEKVSREIVDALKLKLSAKEKQKIAERPIDDVQAYECYLKAQHEIGRWTKEGLERALQYLKNGLDIVGENALLYAGIAYTHLFLMNIGVDIEENRKKAEEQVKKALALDPGMPKAHAVLGMVHTWYRGTTKNLKEAIYHLKKALAGNPYEHQALVGLIVIYGYAGKLDQSIALVERLKKIEPLDMWSLWWPGHLNYLRGHFDLALQEWRKGYEVDPKNPFWQAWYARALLATNQEDEAFTMIEQGAKATPDYVHTKLVLMLKHGLLGDKEAAIRELTAGFKKWCRGEGGWSSFIADTFALLDEKEKAMDWLEHAVDLGYIDYPWFFEIDPYLENIRGEERFKNLMERMKHEWESFEV